MPGAKIHRDLKLENILLYNPTSGVLADFGHSCSEDGPQAMMQKVWEPKVRPFGAPAPLHHPIHRGTLFGDELCPSQCNTWRRGALRGLGAFPSTAIFPTASGTHLAEVLAHCFCSPKPGLYSSLL